MVFLKIWWFLKSWGDPKIMAFNVMGGSQNPWLSIVSMQHVGRQLDDILSLAGQSPTSQTMGLWVKTTSLKKQTECLNVQVCRTRCLQTAMKILEVLGLSDSIWKALSVLSKTHVLLTWLQKCRIFTRNHPIDFDDGVAPPLQIPLAFGLRRRNKQRCCIRCSRCKPSNPDMSPNSLIGFLNASIAS